MAKKPQSKSARIRKLLEQGKPVKQIAAIVKCTPALVYQVKAYDKKKAAPKKVDTVKDAQKRMQNEWVFVETSTSKEPIGIPKDVYKDHFGNVRVRGAIQPKDYTTPKQNVVQRFFNWLCGG